MTGKRGETPSNEALMPGSGAMLPERQMQPALSFLEAFQLLAFILVFWTLWRAIGYLPNREDRGPVTSELSFIPLHLDAAGFGPLSLVGAWELRSPDPRFGGFSGLALHQGNLLALTDNGALASFSKPGSKSRPVVTMTDLPDGPGDSRYIWNRDAEALALDPLGRGWWVAFEVKHQLWLYDRNFTRALKQVRLGADRWPVNGGVEALVGLPGPELLIFAEDTGRLFRVRGSSVVSGKVPGARAGVSDAALLPDGRLALIERSFGVTGFHNSLAILVPDKTGFRISERLKLPAGVLANLEGLAVEARQGGSTRLWIISDDNFQRPLRTLLLAVDLPPERKAS